MLPPPADRPKLAAALAQLSGTVEELLLSGLTTASDSTRQLIHTTMQEAARFKLARLGATLRVLADDLGRFARHDPLLSRRRLTLFLNRTWLLSRGLAHALQTGDEKEYDRIAWSPPTKPLPKVEVVCLGVVKKVTAAIVAFEFRFRAVADAPPVTAGQRLGWSAVFPVKPGTDIPPEGYLHLPQKQKFAPFLFLDGKVVTIENAAVVLDEAGGGRVSLGEQSTVTLGKAFDGWDRYLDWAPAAALDRVRKHAPGPLDLDNELQEEVVLRDYQIAPPVAGDEPGQKVYPVTAGRLAFSALVGAGAEGKALAKSLDELRKLKKNRPPLFGLLHYEKCRLVLQPLAAFDPDPDYLTISKENVNKAALLKAMNFK